MFRFRSALDDLPKTFCCMPIVPYHYQLGIACLPIRICTCSAAAHCQALNRGAPPFKILRRVFTAISTSPPTVLHSITQFFFSFSFPNPTPNCNPWPPSQSPTPLHSVTYHRQKSGTNARWRSSQASSFFSGSLPD
jgi:hypothetical protein